jgi:DNA-binding transcriptional LysR family regulator
MRIAVVAAPSYFAKRSAPRKPQDLTDHKCINLRLPTHGGLYACEFEKGGRELRVRVDGQLVLNGTAQMLDAALAGFGLAYVPEDLAQPHLAKGRLERVLEDWCPRIRATTSITRAAASPCRRLRCRSMRCATGVNAAAQTDLRLRRNVRSPDISLRPL